MFQLQIGDDLFAVLDEPGLFAHDFREPDVQAAAEVQMERVRVVREQAVNEPEREGPSLVEDRRRPVGS